MIRSLKEKISWLYLQYTFVTGIYLLDPIEIYVFNMIALGILSLMMYSCVVFLPAYTMKLINQAHVVILQKEEIN